ncbi:MAG: hypothetical protein Kow00120_28780 [Anaerolineae bacterium]
MLLDNRPERAGVKFADADLIGAPLRLTLSERTLETQSVEYKWRDRSEKGLLALEKLPERVRALLAERA